MTVAKDNPQNEGDVTIIKPVLPEKLPLLKPGHEAAARHRFCGLPEVIFAGGIYCMASTGMVRGGGMAACTSKPLQCVGRVVCIRRQGAGRSCPPRLQGALQPSLPGLYMF